MPKSVVQIRSLARSHTRTALNVLVGVMRNANATGPARISGNAVLAQAHQVNPQTIANVALLDIDLTVALLGANGVN